MTAEQTAPERLNGPERLRVNGGAATEHCPEYIRADLHAALERRCAELERDAERYRFVRKSHCAGYPSSEGSESKDAYLIVTGYGYSLSDEDVDAAIDAAMAKEAK